MMLVMPHSPVVTVQGPTVVRRQLGTRLRQLREEAGQTIKAVADAKIFSTSKMIRVENGKIEVKAGDVWTLCRFYGVTDSVVIDSLALLADGTGERGWWEEYGDRVPDWFALYLGLEQGADEVLIWNPELVPGLLQTAEYAEAVLRAGGLLDVSGAVQLRLDRQQRFFQRNAAPLRVALNPAPLLCEVGGAELAYAQRQHLRSLAAGEHVDLRILPWSAGAPAGLTGGFTIFGFDNEADPSAVYLESLRGGRYLEQADEVSAYRLAFESIWQLATPIEEQHP
jgi:transcriptional regulator with XRE-family HTH domain